MLEMANPASQRRRFMSPAKSCRETPGVSASCERPQSCCHGGTTAGSDQHARFLAPRGDTLAEGDVDIEEEEEEHVDDIAPAKHAFSQWQPTTEEVEKPFGSHAI